MRISELAAELGVSSAFIVAELKKIKITEKTASSSIDASSIALVKKVVSAL